MASVKATVGIDHLDSDEEPMPGRVELSRSEEGITILIIPDGDRRVCAWAIISPQGWKAAWRHIRAIRFQEFLDEHDWEMTIEEAEEMLKLVAEFEEQEAEA